MASERRKSRRVTLQVLYEHDCTGHDVVTSISHLVAESEISEESAIFVQDLVQGVLINQVAIDLKIKKYAPNFPVSQLSIIDRAILRIAVFEITISKQVPVKVAINEAVELAKSFGNTNSSKFVNGVLRSVSNMVPQS